MVASRCIGRSLDCFLDVRMDGAVVPRLSKTGLDGVVCLALSKLHGDDGENDNQQEGCVILRAAYALVKELECFAEVGGHNHGHCQPTFDATLVQRCRADVFGDLTTLEFELPQIGSKVHGEHLLE